MVWMEYFFIEHGVKKTDFWSYPAQKKTHPWHQVLWLQNVEDALCKFIGQVKFGTMAAMDNLTLLEGIASTKGF